MKLNRTPNPLDRSARNGENGNWDIIEGAVNEVKTTVDDFIGTVSDEVINELIDNAQLNWIEFVDSFIDLPSDAKKGDTVLTRDDGKVYRFDGSEWVNIQQIDINAVNEIEQRLDDKFTSRINEIDNAVNEIEQRLDDKFTSRINEIDNAVKLNYLFDKIYGTLSPYVKPSEFGMSIPFPVWLSPSGKVKYDYDVSTKKNTVSKRYYVDVNNGDNTNDGTESNPFKTLERAFRYGDADEIILKSGIYDWSNGQAGTGTTVTQKKNLNLIGEGEVYLGAHRGYRTWSNEGGGVYKTTISNVSEVIDINNYNSPKFYERKNSVEGLSDKVGTYFVNGDDVYVRTISGNAPNEKVLLNMVNNALQLNDFENVYLENIRFTNTFMMDNPNAKGVLSVKDCDFRFGTNDNAISIYGDIEFYFQNCKAEYGERDGFNYHVRNNKLPQGFELDCYGAFNGRDGANQNNGSTMHDGGKITRINGEYHDNQGPNVIDVNPGTQSLNIGVHAHNSTSTSDLVNVDFRTRDADMWLVNCVSHDSKYSTSKEGDANLYVDNSLLLEPDSEL